MEQRGQAIRVMITLVNWQQDEPIGYGGGRQLSMDGTSRVTGDSHARICERLGVQIPGATRRRSAMVVPTATMGAPGSKCTVPPVSRIASMDTVDIDDLFARTLRGDYDDDTPGKRSASQGI